MAEAECQAQHVPAQCSKKSRILMLEAWFRAEDLGAHCNCHHLLHHLQIHAHNLLGKHHDHHHQQQHPSDAPMLLTVGARTTWLGTYTTHCQLVFLELPEPQPYVYVCVYIYLNIYMDPYRDTYRRCSYVSQSMSDIALSTIAYPKLCLPFCVSQLGKP